jgi:hypothetical protein
MELSRESPLLAPEAKPFLMDANDGVIMVHLEDLVRRYDGDFLRTFRAGHPGDAPALAYGLLEGARTRHVHPFRAGAGPHKAPAYAGGLFI